MSFRDSFKTDVLLKVLLVSASSWMIACSEQAPPAATNGGSGGGKDYSGMSASSSTPNIADCSSSTAVLLQSVQGGGPSVKGCLEINGNGSCAALANYVPLSTSSKWIYSSGTDTWTSTVNLQNSGYTPGNYTAHVYSSDGKVKRIYTYALATTNGVTCNAPGGTGAMTATSTPSNVANCSSTTASISMTVVGGGPGAKGCVDFNSSTDCLTPSNFVALNTVSEFVYTAANDTWTFTQQTRSHPWIVPGVFHNFFKSGDGTKSANTTYTIATTGSQPTNCNP